MGKIDHKCTFVCNAMVVLGRQDDGGHIRYDICNGLRPNVGSFRTRFLTTFGLSMRIGTNLRLHTLWL